jgi:hypothetical protein
MWHVTVSSTCFETHLWTQSRTHRLRASRDPRSWRVILWPLVMMSQYRRIKCTQISEAEINPQISSNWILSEFQDQRCRLYSVFRWQRSLTGCTGQNTVDMRYNGFIATVWRPWFYSQQCNAFIKPRTYSGAQPNSYTTYFGGSFFGVKPQGREADLPSGEQVGNPGAESRLPYMPLWQCLNT